MRTGDLASEEELEKLETLEQEHEQKLTTPGLGVLSSESGRRAEREENSSTHTSLSERPPRETG